MRPVVTLALRVSAARGEALVVAEVEVGLGAVVGDEDLAVLVRRHRAGVDVDVRVELHVRDTKPARFHQRADRRGGETLADRGDDAAGDEDELGSPAHGSTSGITRLLSRFARFRYAQKSGTRVESREFAAQKVAEPRRDPSCDP